MRYVLALIVVSMIAITIRSSFTASSELATIFPEPFNMKEWLISSNSKLKENSDGCMNVAPSIRKLEVSVLSDPSLIEDFEFRTNLSNLYLLYGDPLSALKLLDTGKVALMETLIPSLYNQGVELVRDKVAYGSYFGKNYDDSDRLMGLVNLRLAELENCQHSHNSQMCILPIKGEGIHSKKNGAEMAIKHFESSLQDEVDPVTQWLLNVSYSTLGRYPRDVPSEYYIDFERFETGDNKNIKYRNIASELGVGKNTLYGASAFEDFNNDGALDLFATSGDINTQPSIYTLDSSGRYTDYAREFELYGLSGGVHCEIADYNNDGLQDIYVLRGGWIEENASYYPNSLLLNLGDKFVDVTKEVGVLEFEASHTASWADFNQDGWLDLFVGNENAPSKLYQNTGNSNFTEVSELSGISLSEFVKGSVWGDFNNDGLDDLYVSVYNSENKLYQNQGEDKEGTYHFIDVSESALVQEPIKSFGVIALDFNNDGWLDIYSPHYKMSMANLVGDYLGEENSSGIKSKLYINQRNGTFKPLDDPNMNRTLLPMGLNAVDSDNDGWLDIYHGTGYPDFAALVPNFMFRNQIGKSLEDITLSSGLGHLQKGHGISIGDPDKDGDNDIYVSLGGFFEADRFNNALFENISTVGDFIVLKLQGVESNLNGIGARINIVVKDENGEVSQIHRTIGSISSYGTQSFEQVIGLGNVASIESLEVYWPKTSSRQVFYDLPIGQKFICLEGTSSLLEEPYKP
jgi:hypothetical protein